MRGKSVELKTAAHPARGGDGDVEDVACPMPRFLRDRGLKLLMFGGKGGVGKTTCAAASALALARGAPEASFLLVSTDPAHSLADCFAGGSTPANLEVLELDSRKCLDAFKEEHGRKLQEMARRGTFLDEGDIRGLTDLSLPGLDEAMAFLEISQRVDALEYECIVVDTAPTGHTMRLLGMPGLMRGWLGALDSLLEKHRYMIRRFSRFRCGDELDRFLAGMAETLERTERLLRDASRCRFVPVTLAEPLVLAETEALVRELGRLKLPVREIVVNRLCRQARCNSCEGERLRQAEELKRLFERLHGFEFWGIEQHVQEVSGINRLESFWRGAERIEDSAALSREPDKSSINDQGRASEDSEDLVEEPVRFPSSRLKLLIFAGKGGVGKTTLSCATALNLARRFKGKEVLLFSTDPAHSLSACLGANIGPAPARVCEGLTAMEIDAEQEFKSLKAQYREELGEFLRSFLPNMDMTFDRKVMERLLDLSPSGLDEVMAVSRVCELLEKRSYDLFVIDSAPTGHLIRFLELPQLVDQWLKFFFRIFLKYRNVFRLPGVQKRLVEMSKSLKLLKTLLANPDEAALYGVSILTEMALEETKDLVAACDRMGVNVPALFLNLGTRKNGCPDCLGRRRFEADVRRRFLDGFPNKPQCVVFRQESPLGIEKLSMLGQILYQPQERVEAEGGMVARGFF